MPNMNLCWKLREGTADALVHPFETPFLLCNSQNMTKPCQWGEDGAIAIYNATFVQKQVSRSSIIIGSLSQVSR